jgi:pilus assembly protein CpaB
VARHRRWLAAGLAALGAAAALQALTPPTPAGSLVWVAARDLPAGRALAGPDLRPVRWPVTALPDGVAGSQPSGVLAAPVRRGEPVTDVRLVGPALLAGQQPGTVAMTIRVADPATVLTVRPGSRVDVLAVPMGAADVGALETSTDPSTGRPAGPVAAAVLAHGALVLALPGDTTGQDPVANSGNGSGGGSGGWLGGAASTGSSGSDPGAGGVLVLAVDRGIAAELAAAQTQQSLTVVLS